MDAFDYGKILVRPVGDFIKIIPVAPMRGDKSAVMASIYGDKGIIEYWYDKREKVQTWRSEMTCMPVFMMPSRIYSVDVTSDATATVSTLSDTASTTKATTKSTTKKTTTDSEADGFTL